LCGCTGIAGSDTALRWWNGTNAGNTKIKKANVGCCSINCIRNIIGRIEVLTTHELGDKIVFPILGLMGLFNILLLMVDEGPVGLSTVISNRCL